MQHASAATFKEQNSLSFFPLVSCILCSAMPSKYYFVHIIIIHIYMILLTLLFSFVSSIIYLLTQRVLGNPASSFLRFTYFYLAFILLYLSNLWFSFFFNQTSQLLLTLFDSLQLDISLLSLYLVFCTYTAFFLYYLSNSQALYSSSPVGSEYIYYILCNLFALFIILFCLDQLTLLVAFETFNFMTYFLIYFHSPFPGSNLSSASSHSIIPTTLYYFILSALSSCLFLSGLLFLYYHTGSFSFPAIHLSSTSSFVGFLSIFLFLFQKAGLFPTFSWALDFYPRLSIPLLLYLLIIPKSLFLFLLNLYSSFSPFSSPLLLFSGLASMLIGSIGLFSSNHIILFLLYSSLSHLGWSLLALSDSS
jgi:NADH-quinone oxidoreductase subunit N